MARFDDKLKAVQRFLHERGIDGWLLYDFKRLNPLACSFLEIPTTFHLTRRFFYWIPQRGEPTALVSAVENPLEALPGKKIVFKSWQELEKNLSELLKEMSKIAMEYSPMGYVPEVSKVDAGTLEQIRSWGLEVVSSGDLYQHVSCILTSDQVAAQKRAAKVLEDTVERTWEFVKQGVGQVTEKEIQEFMAQAIVKSGCMADSLPIAAVNAHTADPHHVAGKTVVRKGDFLLIDLWAKETTPHAVYADITRVAVVAKRPTEEQEKVFRVVKKAQSFATELVRTRFMAGKPIFGWEVDEAARHVIQDAGYGEFFVHRTGHNIYESDHGPGCHNDNLETREQRELLKGTCCSIEPGIYLPGKFGVRLEYDLVIGHNGEVEITGGVQEEITCIF